MATEILDNIVSGNGLLPGGTKPLPEKFWLIVSKVQWDSSENNVTRDTSAINY